LLQHSFSISRERELLDEADFVFRAQANSEK
jgi:hypothetical protein